MLNPILSDLALTMEQVKNIEKTLRKTHLSEKGILILLVENSGQVIASNGNNSKKYDLSIIAALSVGSFEATRGLAKAMGQTFNHVENKGTSSNLYISRVTDQTILVIDYDPEIPQEEITSVVNNFAEEINGLSKEWQIVQKGTKTGKGPLTGAGLGSEIDDMFNSFN